MLKLLVYVCVLASCEKQRDQQASPAVMEAIRLVEPEARVIGRDDVDLASCAGVSDSPGIIRADFDGDGTQDTAVLMTVDQNEVVQWGSERLHSVELLLALFRREDDEKISPSVLKRENSFLPLAAWIRERAPGHLGEDEQSRPVFNRFPAIEFVYCERSIAVYYWDGSAFREFYASD